MAGGLNDEDVPPPHVFQYLTVIFPVREVEKLDLPQTDAQVGGDLIRQLRVPPSRKDNRFLVHSLHLTPWVEKNMDAWLGRVDSNHRSPVPKTGALPLGYSPVRCNGEAQSRLQNSNTGRSRQACTTGLWPLHGMRKVLCIQVLDSILRIGRASGNRRVRKKGPGCTPVLLTQSVFE